MNHSDLTTFLQRSRAALRDETSLIFVKENVCEDGTDGKAIEILDEEDSSLTRYLMVSGLAIRWVCADGRWVSIGRMGDGWKFLRRRG